MIENPTLLFSNIIMLLISVNVWIDLSINGHKSLMSIYLLPTKESFNWILYIWFLNFNGQKIFESPTVNFLFWIFKKFKNISNGFLYPNAHRMTQTASKNITFKHEYKKKFKTIKNEHNLY